MDRDALRDLLDAVARGALPAEAAFEEISRSPVSDLVFATIDHDRGLRSELPEVVFAPGKTPAQLATIAREVFDRSGRVLVTRLAEEQRPALREALPELEFHESARLAWSELTPRARRGAVVVATAGTSDIPVAEEAAITAELAGAAVTRIFDVGVAGLHRLMPHLPVLRAANAIVVAAGMDGALASVVGGLVANPVIAVPTAVGYGASFGGLAALLTMLNSCASGVAVMNVDNGFGAGCMAATINRLAVEGARRE